MFGMKGNDQRVLHNSIKGDPRFLPAGEQNENRRVIYIKYK
jgi:hypothetical protein